MYITVKEINLNQLTHGQICFLYFFDKHVIKFVSYDAVLVAHNFFFFLKI